MYNNYYDYDNGNRTISTKYDRHTAELIAITAMRHNANIIRTHIVDSETGEVVRTYIQ